MMVMVHEDDDDRWVLKLMESSLYIYIYIKELVRFLRGWLVDIVGLL